MEIPQTPNAFQNDMKDLEERMINLVNSTNGTKAAKKWVTSNLMNLEKHMQQIVNEAIAPQKTNAAATMLNRDSINRAYKGLSELEKLVANNVRHTDNQHQEQLLTCRRTKGK